MNQRYASSAVAGDGSPDETWSRDPELYHQPTTRPGAKLPHAWLADDHGQRLSTLDLAGGGRFTVVTGVSGLAWETAAAVCAGELGIEIGVARIGSAGIRDAYGEWARLREIDEDGGLLVRPDGYIAWRQPTAPPDDRAAAGEN